MLKEFVILDRFDSIIGVFIRYFAGDRSLYILSREFGVLDRFKSIASGFSKGVIGKGRNLFYLSFKFLSSWLIRQICYHITQWPGWAYDIFWGKYWKFLY